MNLDLPEGIGTETATEDEIRTAIQRGQAAGADFVMLVRETEEDGSIDEQTLMIFCPAEGGQREMWDRMAHAGHAVRCNLPTREERRRHEAIQKDSQRLHGAAGSGEGMA